MLFTEFHFIFLFVPLTLLAFELAPTINQKLVVLTLASFVFYAGWDPKFLPMLIFSLATNYWFSVQLAKTKSKRLLVLALIANLVPIAYFKYSGLIASLFTHKIPKGIFKERLGSLLPIGISFYTFQQIAYLVDIYTGKFKPTDGLRFVFCTTFFPHLVAGPIVQFKDLVPQLDQPTERTKRFMEGVFYFAIGFTKKFFIADTFAAFSDPIYGAPGDMHLERSLIAMLGYTFQLYFDFSGYSDMAIGLARLFGWQLPWNFNSPYKATSISDFWRRWHMTLSGFLRDYVYIGLGGNRGGDLERYKNLLLTMLIGGLWHGAAWTFVVWGGLHGLALAINSFWNRHIGIRLGPFGWLLTFSTVALLWVLFRSTSFEEALAIYRGFLTFKGFVDTQFWMLTLGGFIMLTLPNSHAIVAWLSDRWFSSMTFDVPALTRRLGIYAALSWAVLTAASIAFYAGGIDRIIYSRFKTATELGISHHEYGDFRSTLWSKHLLTVPSHRLAIVGSSFSNAMGGYRFSANGAEWQSESFGMSGNGFLNAARSAFHLGKTGSVDVIVLAISPLNFGKTLGSGPFQGQCLDGLEGKFPKIPIDRWGACEAHRLGSLDIINQPLLPFKQRGYQFRHFFHEIGLAVGHPAPLNVPNLDLSEPAVDKRLQAIKGLIAASKQSPMAVPNLANGSDGKFQWVDRNVMTSLGEGGEAFEILAAIKETADRQRIPVIAYETPTASHEALPGAFPEGFFPAYQDAVKGALKKLDIPYLDLSALFPWDGNFMLDFIHTQPHQRALLHEIVLYWIFHPDKLKASGILPDAVFDATWRGL